MYYNKNNKKFKNLRIIEVEIRNLIYYYKIRRFRVLLILLIIKSYYEDFKVFEEYRNKKIVNYYTYFVSNKRILIY